MALSPTIIGSSETVCIRQTAFGNGFSPFDCYLIRRGIKMACRLFERFDNVSRANHAIFKNVSSEPSSVSESR